MIHWIVNLFVSLKFVCICSSRFWCWRLQAYFGHRSQPRDIFGERDDSAEWGSSSTKVHVQMEPKLRLRHPSKRCTKRNWKKRLILLVRSLLLY